MLHTDSLKILRPLRRGRAIAMVIAAVGLGACSSEAMYRAIQLNRQQACEQIPIAQQASCKAQYQTDYESYKRQRESLSTAQKAGEFL